MKKNIAGGGRAVIILLILILVGVLASLVWYQSLPIATDDAALYVESTSVASEITGYVKKIYIKNGQKVKKGQLLLELYQIPYDIAIKETQTALRSSQQHLTDLANELVIDEKLTDKRKQAAHSADVKVQQVEQNESNDQYSHQKVLQLEQQAVASHAALSIAKKRLVDAKAQVLQQREKIKQLREKLNQTKLELSKTEIHIKKSCVVSAVAVGTGKFINAGQTLFRCVDTNHWWVRAYFDRGDASKIKQGQRVKVTLYSYPKVKTQGIVTAVTRRDSTPELALKASRWVEHSHLVLVRILLSQNVLKYPLHQGERANVELLK